MSQKPTYSPKPRFSKGFRRASTLVQDRIRDGGASRGFAVSRLLTHWGEIVGEETARNTRPVNVSYGKGGMGATLTVLARGAMGPELQMQEPKIREKVNACYGYQAISRIRFTQTAGTGFAEGQAQFAPAPKAAATSAAPAPEVARAGAEMSQGVQDEGLRALLAELGAKVLTRRN
ncbi:DUF721 domain-containing protein [Alphaproteobacteria bacterium KMM 3653]|uniref:DUF721 domain-containing protein n=1 Tax=Harenicola maris TaxID=2841044 RepID=A0AAP2CP69_9RHOB|nr:DUF721 domain-containing protein [Harenicola maris]